MTYDQGGIHWPCMDVRNDGPAQHIQREPDRIDRLLAEAQAIYAGFGEYGIDFDRDARLNELRIEINMAMQEQP